MTFTAVLRKAGAHERIEGIENLDKIINIDQAPIGPHTALKSGDLHGTFDYIRSCSQ